MAERTGDVVYRIDRADRILEVSDAWVEFASRNQGEHLLPPAILGHVLWDSISDATTRELYRMVLNRVRKGAGPVQFRIRCDSPDTRRELEMRIALAGDGEVSFTAHLLREEKRAPVPLLDAAVPRSDALLRICGWCKRVPLADGSWLEVEAAVEALRLFEEAELPRLSHGMCPDCRKAMESVLDS